MYTQFFGLNEKPFSLTPDPKYLFLGEHHKECYAQLLYSIKENVGFTVLIGEVGTGKTTLCRAFLAQHGHGRQAAYLFNPNLNEMELLRSLNRELGIEHRLTSKKALLDLLHAHLLRSYEENRTVLLVVDEAQGLSPETLEQLRLLSNLETDTRKLIQIVLVGQPELGLLLEKDSLRQLKQRVAVWSRLFPLNHDETCRYVSYRLRMAGCDHGELFTHGALKEVFKFSQGVPRLINAACDRALLAAFSADERQVTAAILRKSAAEVSGRPAGQGWLAKSFSALTAALAMGALAGFIATGAFSGVFSAEARQGIKAPSGPIVTNQQGPIASPTPGRHAIGDALPFIGQDAAIRAAETVLARWGDTAPLSAAERSMDPAAIARGRGFKCFSATMTLAQLAAINYPAMVEVSDGDRTGYLPLLEIVGDEYLAAAGGTLYATHEWMEKHWTGKAHIFWKDFENLPELIKRGSSGQAVNWVQQSLRRLGYIGDADAVTGSYGPKTERSVLIFQIDNQLPPDGQVGDSTKMVIYGLLPDYRTPRMSFS